MSKLNPSTTHMSGGVYGSSANAGQIVLTDDVRGGELSNSALTLSGLSPDVRRACALQRADGRTDQSSSASCRSREGPRPPDGFGAWAIADLVGNLH